MADNPFEDPSVVAAADANPGQPPPAPANAAYGDNNAYDDVNIDVGMIQAAAKYVPEDKQKELAVAAGSAVANQAADRVKSDYNESTKTQADHHEAPPPPNFCVKLFNWIPIRLLALVAGVLLIAGPLLDLILPFVTVDFIGFFIYVYLIMFGVVTVFIESPTFGCTRLFQLRLFFWFRLLSRMWGRGCFYLFTSILCFASLGGDNPGIFTGIAGGYLIVVCILSFIFSRMAAKKFARIREFVAAGAEKEELEGRFLRKFDELDNGGQAGTIGSDQIVTLAAQASRDLSNSERHAIQTFLDESCNGFVSKDDFMRQFVTQYAEKGFKQKFL